MWFRNKRTPFKAFLDRHGILQKEIAEEAGVSENTVTKACSDHDYIPSAIIKKKLLKAAKKVNPHIRPYDFWDV